MSATIDQISNKFFDYVIVGGGTAGLTVAARLTEDPSVSVLVLEAGVANINEPNILRPASFGTHFVNPSYTWMHQTTKQTHAADVQFPWARGKGLGGSSGINFLCWLKPPAEEINDIEKLGNPGWNWNNYQKYLSKTEGFVEPSEEIKKANKLNFDNWEIGRNGPLKVSYPGTIEEGEMKLQQTFINAGLSPAARPLSGDPAGTYLTPNTYDPETHTRTYATTAFYLPNKDRPNFSVLLCAEVTQILSEKTANGNFTAVGVEFEHDGKAHVVNSKKEVIVAAGCLRSPQLLELSGIGDKAILDKIEVPLKIDLPGVGTNVQEHMFVSVGWEIRDDYKFDTLDMLRDPEYAAKALQLHAEGTGIYTTGVIGFNFAPVTLISKNKGSEIIQAAKEKILKNAESYPPGLLEQYKVHLDRLERDTPGCEFISFPSLLGGPNSPAPGKRYLCVLVAMNECFSRGTIHSLSGDPHKDPEFNPNYLKEEADLHIWTEMVKFTRNLANLEPLKDIITKEHNPGPEVQSDEDIHEWIKRQITSTWHTAGSCSMLPRDKNGVVDSNLKVYGTNNVRVVDLSIVPLHFAAHPQATVYAVAEQAADIIKGKFVV